MCASLLQGSTARLSVVTAKKVRYLHHTRYDSRVPRNYVCAAVCAVCAVCAAACAACAGLVFVGCTDHLLDRSEWTSPPTPAAAGFVAVPAAASPTKADGPDEPDAPDELPPDQQTRLTSWYTTVGARRPNETIGELAVRAALVQIGKPYFDPPPSAEPEILRVELGSFQCVSLVESSLSVARCIFVGTPDGPCFLREIEEWRYRNGVLDGGGSRMHYFSEWILDNARRGRLRDITTEVGGKESTYPFFYMSTHAALYPFLSAPEELGAIKALEARLSALPVSIIDRNAVAHAQRKLSTGDVIAVIGNKPGLLVSHTGFILRDSDGVTHLLHASSHNKRVMVTRGDIANYIVRWPERLGLMVTRPEPPPPAAKIANN